MYKLLRSRLLFGSLGCFAVSCVLFLQWLPTLADPIETTVTLGRASKSDKNYSQDVTIRFRNCSRRTIRIIGFIPYCCSGKFSFAVKSVGTMPPELAPGEHYTIECEAGFAESTQHSEDRLERVAGQLLMDIDRQLIRQDVSVCIVASEARRPQLADSNSYSGSFAKRLPSAP